MTQEEKDALIRDLCARLPYGVKVKFEYVITSPAKIIGINKFFIECEDVSADIEDIKPYLFPLSSMTEEQKQELYNLMEESAFQIIHSEDGNPQPHIAMDWYNKNHFDYRGLIPMGLAEDATGLNIY